MLSPATLRATEEAMHSGRRLSRFAAPAVREVHAANARRLLADPTLLNAYRILARREKKSASPT